CAGARTRWMRRHASGERLWSRERRATSGDREHRSGRADEPAGYGGPLMAGDRYVILGLAHPRAAWFPSVAQWAHASSIPVELVKCLSAEELRARLGSGRAFSAAIVDS